MYIESETKRQWHRMLHNMSYKTLAKGEERERENIEYSLALMMMHLNFIVDSEFAMRESERQVDLSSQRKKINEQFSMLVWFFAVLNSNR